MPQPPSYGLLAKLFPRLRRALDRTNELELALLKTSEDLHKEQKELDTYKKQVLAHMKKNVDLVMEINDTKEALQKIEGMNREQDEILEMKDEQIMELEKIIENPMVRLKELPDDRDTCYVWLIPRERDINEFRTMLASTYIHRLGREPKAMHLVLHKVEDIQLFTRAEVESKLKSWLKE